MNIINIGKKKGNYYSIYLNNNFIGFFHIETIKYFKIKDGESYDDLHIESFRHEGEIKYAKDRALFLLSYRDYSTKELIQKLQKNVPMEIAEITAERMKELNLIDDKRFAKNLANKLILNKGRGVKRVLYEMELKGVEKEDALEAIDSIKFNSIDQISKTIRKKYMDKLSDYKSKNKVIAVFLRKGHFYNDIKSAINIVEQEIEENKY